MRITRVESWRVDMRLAEPYTIAYETVDRVSNLLLRIDLDAGPSGFGCAAPDLAVTGESPETVLEVLRRVVEPVLKGADPMRRLVHLETLEDHEPSQGVAAPDHGLHHVA